MTGYGPVKRFSSHISVDKPGSSDGMSFSQVQLTAFTKQNVSLVFSNGGEESVTLSFARKELLAALDVKLLIKMVMSR